MQIVAGVVAFISTNSVFPEKQESWQLVVKAVTTQRLTNTFNLSLLVLFPSTNLLSYIDYKQFCNAIVDQTIEEIKIIAHAFLQLLQTENKS